ncbi:MAG TPA: transcriptional regulator [Microbacterium sp.]|nr:transcriptional regulator [Microbacterium sp.]
MAARGGSSSRGGSPRRGGPAGKGGSRSGGARPSGGSARKSTPKRYDREPPATPTPAGPFRLGAVPGATPGKWIDTWKQRMPHVALDLTSLTVADQRSALARGEVDAAIVRLPLDADGLHVIPLYDEITVVVCDVDSPLTAADELTEADLEGEVVIVPGDDVLGIRLEGTASPRFENPATTGEAIETVATGVGVVVVPMSLARLHHRKDVTFRPLVGAPTSPVALAWPVDATTPLVDAFVGIVRGRTANSSR